MSTPAEIKEAVCKALMGVEILEFKVASSQQMQGFLDAIKAWTLPAVGVLYDGRTRNHPSEQAMQVTRSVSLQFTILVATSNFNSAGMAAEDPLGELEAIRRAVASVRLPSGKPCVFMSERIIKSTDKLTVWGQKWQVATNVT